jgi:Tol biopolymer transport system component/predicted Ser/Thr protein kinase
VTGRTISHYRVLEKLGEGGMGVVWKAEDLLLDRIVALKFLHASDDLPRLLREARVAASLNHPSICAVYEVDPGGGFLAMEFVEGESLAGKIAGRPLPVEQAVALATQVCEGLKAAHAKGIIHRDIKSGNILVTGEGQAKILDFGLARLAGQAALTREGTAAGTPGYMAPEQLRGEAVDRRTDIWALGAVLHEMLTGRLPMGQTDTLPEGLGRVVRKALAADPRERYQHVEDMLVDLRRAAATPSLKPSRPRWLWAVAAAVGVALVAFAAWYGTTRPGSPKRTELRFTQLTDQAGEELYPSLSPDGNTFVYASRAAGNWDIYLQRVGGQTAVNLTKDSPADDTQPAFSPDAQWIAFRSERAAGGIFVMGATGESVRKISDAGYLPAWSPDGRKIACSTASFERPESRPMARSQIFVVDTTTGERTLLTAGMQDAIQAQWSPHGLRIAFFVIGSHNARDVWTMSVTGQDRRPVTNDSALDWNPVWSPDGKYLCFASDRGGAMNLWRVRIDESSGKLLEQPEPISTPSSYAAWLSVSRDGRRGLYASLNRRSNLHSVGFDPVRGATVGEMAPVLRGSHVAMTPAVSPDGNWLAFHGGEGQDKLYVVRADGQEMRRLTEDRYVNRVPHWSRDGRWIAFMSNRSGAMRIWAIRPDGSGLRQVSAGGEDRYPVWSPDGKRLVYNQGPRGSFIIEFDKSPDEQRPVRVPVEIAPGGWFGVADWSHDGRLLLGQMTRADGTSKGLGIYSLADGSFEPVAEIGRLPRWLGDGRRILFWHKGCLYLVDRRSHTPQEVFAPSGVLGAMAENFDISPDNRRIYFSLMASEADIWLLEWVEK